MIWDDYFLQCCNNKRKTAPKKASGEKQLNLRRTKLVQMGYDPEHTSDLPPTAPAEGVLTSEEQGRDQEPARARDLGEEDWSKSLQPETGRPPPSREKPVAVTLATGGAAGCCLCCGPFSTILKM